MRKPTTLALPSHVDVAQPLMMLMYLSGGPLSAIRSSSAYQPLADYFHLSNATRSLTLHDLNGSGCATLKWENVVQFARWELIKYGYLLPKEVQGAWQLSESGRTEARRIIEKEGVASWACLEVSELALTAIAPRSPGILNLDDLEI